MMYVVAYIRIITVVAYIRIITVVAYIRIITAPCVLEMRALEGRYPGKYNRTEP